MVNVTEVIVETSLIASNIVDLPAIYLEDCSEEELHQMVDIPLEGGLLDIEVNCLPSVLLLSSWLELACFRLSVCGSISLLAL